MSAHIQYASYLIRLWRLYEQDSASVEWQSEIQHIQSGKTWNFQTIAELEAFLHQRAREPEGLVCTDTLPAK
jgi:hypothetical protein